MLSSDNTTGCTCLRVLLFFAGDSRRKSRLSVNSEELTSWASASYTPAGCCRGLRTFYPDCTSLCFSSVTSNFLLGWFQACASLLLGPYATSSGSFYRRFGTACRARFEGPRIEKPLKMWPDRLSRNVAKGLSLYAVCYRGRGQVSCWLVHAFVPNDTRNTAT